jgi:hypothetical protein
MSDRLVRFNVHIPFLRRSCGAARHQHIKKHHRIKFPFLCSFFSELVVDSVSPTVLFLSIFLLLPIAISPPDPSF